MKSWSRKLKKNQLYKNHQQVHFKNKNQQLNQILKQLLSKLRIRVKKKTLIIK
jgi:hypothetical protein